MNYHKVQLFERIKALLCADFCCPKNSVLQKKNCVSEAKLDILKKHLFCLKVSFLYGQKFQYDKNRYLFFACNMHYYYDKKKNR